MPNILSLLRTDGATSLATEIRNGVPQYVVDVELTYDENGGEGQSEFLIRNTSSTDNALNVLVTTPAGNYPKDPQTNEVLDQQWDYKPIGTDAWRNRWSASVLIERIPPGQFVHVRTRVLASSESEPTTHIGGIMVKYLRSSV